jgi:hypothetical protein
MGSKSTQTITKGTHPLAAATGERGRVERKHHRPILQCLGQTEFRELCRVRAPGHQECEIGSGITIVDRAYRLR